MDYRVYLLDDDGHVCAREDIIAENDEEAVFSDTQPQNGRAIEAWQLDRKVALINAQKVGPPAFCRR
jgi:hypothetical protein